MNVYAYQPHHFLGAVPPAPAPASAVLTPTRMVQSGAARLYVPVYPIPPAQSEDERQLRLDVAALLLGATGGIAILALQLAKKEEAANLLTMVGIVAGTVIQLARMVGVADKRLAPEGTDT
jgi:NADPH:quinone reductase-like Zn-dependent oxidoreductase